MIDIQYIKDRFKEYHLLVAQAKKQTTSEESKPNIPDQALVRFGRKTGRPQFCHNSSIDFEIVVAEEEFTIGAFSIPKVQLEQGFLRTIRAYVSAALDVPATQIKLLSFSSDAIVADISYNGDPTDCVLHEIRAINRQEFKGPLKPEYMHENNK